MTVGERIKSLRESKGLSQEELAKKMGYSGKTSISKIESSGNNMTTRTVSKFANALGCTEAYLMGWEDNNIHIEQTATIDAELTSASMEDKEYMLKFLNMSPEGKRAVKDFIDFYLSKNK